MLWKIYCMLSINYKMICKRKFNFEVWYLMFFVLGLFFICFGFGGLLLMMMLLEVMVVYKFVVL